MQGARESAHPLCGLLGPGRVPQAPPGRWLCYKVPGDLRARTDRDERWSSAWGTLNQSSVALPEEGESDGLTCPQEFCRRGSREGVLVSCWDFAPGLPWGARRVGQRLGQGWPRPLASSLEVGEFPDSQVHTCPHPQPSALEPLWSWLGAGEAAGEQAGGWPELG